MKNGVRSLVGKFQDVQAQQARRVNGDSQSGDMRTIGKLTNNAVGLRFGLAVSAEISDMTIVALKRRCLMTFGNLIFRLPDSAKNCAESVRVLQETSISLGKMVRGAGIEPATPSV